MTSDAVDKASHQHSSKSPLGPGPNRQDNMDGKLSLKSPFRVVWAIISEVSFFWMVRLYNWYRSKSPRDELLAQIMEATEYEDWQAAADELDIVLGNDVWRLDPSSSFYDWRLIRNRLQALRDAREDQDLATLIDILRSGMVRNLGNITSPRLYNTAFAGTKNLIEQYISELALSVDDLESWPTSPGSTADTANQAKMNVFHDARQAFGRSALVLQGGSMFGLCHIGVVKALHFRGLLPRIIAGTATGAVIAAVVGVHGEEELLDMLTADGINLSAFSRGPGSKPTSLQTRWQTLVRRLRRLIKDGHFLDMDILKQCLLDNVGDLTFEEAHRKTNRILNITIPADDGEGMPGLLNHITAPHVLIWSAALASNANTSPLHSGLPLKCKDEDNNIRDWPSDTISSASLHKSRFSQKIHAQAESPLTRIAELFNVNHFIVSQARPYLAPFLRSDFHRPNPTRRTAAAASSSRQKSSSSSSSSLFPFPISLPSLALPIPLGRILILEIQHRLRQLDSLGYLAPGLRRFVLDENIPGPSLTFVPELTAGDFVRLLERPTREGIDYWILRGQRSVWPAVSALMVRCAVETKLDGAYERVRRGVTYDDVVAESVRGVSLRVGGGGHVSGGGGGGGGGRAFRKRSSSLGQDTI